jgi:tRNA G10  N-methylase Trm11
MDYKKNIILLLMIMLVSCGVSNKEADEAYRNGIEHLSTVKKQPSKKADALYFLLIAAKNDKYKTVDNAIIITSLAADIYSGKKNLTLDEKYKLEDNIITGCKLLAELSAIKNDTEQKECNAEIKNIAHSELPIYYTIKSVLQKKDNSLYKKFVSISKTTE